MPFIGRESVRAPNRASHHPGASSDRSHRSLLMALLLVRRRLALAVSNVISFRKVTIVAVSSTSEAGSDRDPSQPPIFRTPRQRRNPQKLARYEISASSAERLSSMPRRSSPAQSSSSPMPMPMRTPMPRLLVGSQRTCAQCPARRGVLRSLYRGSTASRFRARRGSYRPCR